MPIKFAKIKSYQDLTHGQIVYPHFIPEMERQWDAQDKQRAAENRQTKSKNKDNVKSTKAKN